MPKEDIYIGDAMMQNANNMLSNQQQKKGSCLEEIERLKQNREERRKRMNDLKKQRTEREIRNEAQGIKVDVDFQAMVEHNMNSVSQMTPVNYSFVNVCIAYSSRSSESVRLY